LEQLMGRQTKHVRRLQTFGLEQNENASSFAPALLLFTSLSPGGVEACLLQLFN